MLDAGEIARRWPQFILGGDERGYFEPGGGLVYPERCIVAQLAEAERLGARIVRDERVLRLEETATGVAAVTDRNRHAGATLIVAAGAWTGSLVDLPPGMLILLPQTLHWFAPDTPDDYGADRFPTFIWSRGSGEGESAYGFPLAPGAPTKAVKLGVETRRSVERPEQRDDHGPDPDNVAFERAVAGRLAGLLGAPGQIGGLPLHGHRGLRLRRRPVARKTADPDRVGLLRSRLQTFPGDRRDAGAGG